MEPAEKFFWILTPLALAAISACLIFGVWIMWQKANIEVAEETLAK